MDLGENDAGLDHVYRGEIRFDPNSHTTFVLVDDPSPDVRRGANVQLTAVFFKVSVFRDRQGTLRRSPLVMGRDLEVLSPPSQMLPAPTFLSAVAAVLIAVVIAFFFWRRTRRPIRRFRLPSSEDLTAFNPDALARLTVEPPEPRPEKTTPGGAPPDASGQKPEASSSESDAGNRGPAPRS